VRRQVKAYLTAHGTDPSAVDEETFGDICVMYHDGAIGNLGLLQVLGTLTAGQFNKMLPKGATPYKLQAIIPSAYDYLYPPLTEQDKRAQVTKSLMAFAKARSKPNEVLFKG
jgi:hypothetical protein